MARWATQCIIGTVDLSNCRVEIKNAGGFLSKHTGSVDIANDGTPIIQTVERLRRGVRFTLEMYSIAESDLDSILGQIETAEATQNGIRGQFESGVIDVDIKIVPDYGQQEWVTWDKYSEGFYEGTKMTFISKGDYA